MNDSSSLPAVTGHDWRRWAALLIVSAVVVAAAILLVLSRGSRGGALPELPMVSQQGQQLSTSSLLGRPLIVSLVPANCSERCLLTLGQLSQLQSELGPEVAFSSLLFGPHGGAVSLDRPRSSYRLAADDVATFNQLDADAGIAKQLTSDDGWPVIILLDRAGRLQALVGTTGDGLTPTGQALLSEQAAFLLRLQKRPRLHAGLNAVSALLLVAGFGFIRRRQIRAHATCMLLATLVTVVFLGSYLYYHHFAGSVPFPGSGWAKRLYLAILISHITLAAFVPPLIANLIYLAARRRFDLHRRIAIWVLPMWIYVSITGVVIYFMLHSVAGTGTW